MTELQTHTHSIHTLSFALFRSVALSATFLYDSPLSLPAAQSDLSVPSGAPTWQAAKFIKKNSLLSGVSCRLKAREARLKASRELWEEFLQMSALVCISLCSIIINADIEGFDIFALVGLITSAYTYWSKRLTNMGNESYTKGCFLCTCAQVCLVYLCSSCWRGAAPGSPHLLELHSDLSKRFNNHSDKHVLGAHVK